jgi:hypothetical protein
MLFGCSTISTYDQAAYEKAVNAKVDTLALMDKATSDYADNQKDIDALNLELAKAYEYEKGRPQNIDTVKQWDILLDPNHNLFGGFMKEWKESGSLKSAYVADKKSQIGTAFDQITGLESGKNKPTKQ